MPKDRGPCIKCKTRKARYREGTCSPCHNLLAAEGTHEQYGVDPETPTRKMWREQAAIFNKLAADGKMSLQDIADRMNMTASVLRSLMQRAKIDGKIPVVDLHQRRPDGTRLPPTTKVKKVVTECGKGKWGVPGCKCVSCKAVRRATRASIDIARRGSIKTLRAQIESLLAEKAAPKKRGRPPKVST